MSQRSSSASAKRAGDIPKSQISAGAISSLADTLSPELLAELRRLRVPEASLTAAVGAEVINFPRSPDSPELIQLWRNNPFFMTDARCEIWHYDKAGALEPFGPGGAPALLKCRCPRGRPAREDLAPQEVEYQIEWRWPDGRKTDAEWYSARAIRKGEYLDRFGIPVAGNREIDLFAKIILAQRQAFEIEPEYPVRHSGFSGADEAPAYTLHDGRTLRPGGIIEAGTITGEPPLLQRKRRERWYERFENLPAEPPSEEQLGAATDALLRFDSKGRALCAALLGIRALFYSLVSMDISVLLSGFRGTAKTSIAQIMHWAEGPCAAADEPDMSFRTTFLASELTFDRARDCVFLIDDGERVRAGDPGAPLKPAVITLLSDLARAVFDGAPARARGNKYYTLAQQRQIQQLLVFSAETAIGPEESVLARTIWWSFEAGEIELAPMLAPDWQETSTWIACQETITAAAHALIRRVLNIWSNKGRAAAIDFIREIDKEASALAAAIELGGKSEDRPRIQRGLAMIVAGGILCDAAAGTDGLMRDLVLRHGAQLAQQQLERLASGSLATAGFDLDWFQRAYHQFVGAGDYLLLDAQTGQFFDSHDPQDADWLQDIGYRWLGPTDGWAPAARQRGGWRHRGDRQDWLEPRKFLIACERQAKTQGSVFPFSEKTLPRHLLKIGLTVEGSQHSSTHKPYIPRSDLRHPSRGSQPRVLCISYADTESNPEKIGRTGRSGDISTNDCINERNDLPISPDDVSRSSEHRETFSANIGRPNNELEQLITAPSPDLPVLPEQNDIDIRFLEKTDEHIENIENSGEPINPIAAVHAELGVVVTEASPGFSRSPEQHRETDAGISHEPAARPRMRAAEKPKAALPPSRSQNGKGRSAASRTGSPATASAQRTKDILALDDLSAFLVRPDGTVAPAPELFEAIRPGTPPDVMFDQAEQAGIDQLVLHLSYCHTAGLPREPNPASDNPRVRQSLPHNGLAHPWANLPDDCGWVLSEPGKLLSSMYGRRPDRPGPAIEIMLPGYDGRDHTPLRLAPDAEHLAHTLNEYRNATAVDGRGGFALRGSSPRTWHAILRALSQDRRRDHRILDISEVLAPADYPPPAHSLPECVADLAFAQRVDLLDAGERSAAQLAIIDGNCQYMRQLGAINYGLGKPVLVEKPSDLTRPGWYYGQYAAPDWPERLPAPGWPLVPGEDGWLVAETIAFLVATGCEVTIDRAWQWSGQGRALGRLQKRFSELYDRLTERRDDPALPAPIRFGARLGLLHHKGGYKAGVGQFSVSDNRTKTEPIFSHRPHWRHAIIAASTACILRDLRGAAQRTGQFPVAIATDGLAYLTDDAEGLIDRLGLRQGRRIGQYKLSAVRDAGEMRELLQRAETTTDSVDFGRLNAAIMSMITGTGRAE